MTMGTVLIALPSRLLRDALTRTLSDAGVITIHQVSDLNGALSQLRAKAADPIDVVILDAVLCNTRANAVESIQRAGGQARIVVLGYDISAIGSDYVMAADGVLTFDITADVMVRSLRLIQNGERVVPRDLMQAIAARTRTNRERSAPLVQIPQLGRSQAPSPREEEILQGLLQGCSNKLIGRKLGITETTVKVHLKSLLRKINASNRTQAAMWALTNGYTVDALSTLFSPVAPVSEAGECTPAAVPARQPRRLLD